MNKGVLVGILLAVMASAVTAGIVVVVAQQDSGEPEVGPSKALRPSEITQIPAGTPAVSLTEPIEHGPFRILPAGTAPPGPCDLPVRPDLTKERVDIRESPTQQERAEGQGPALDKFRDHDLFFEPPYLPVGWELTEAHVETVIWDDGSRTGSMFYLTFSRPDYFPIQIGRVLLAPGCKVEYVEYLPEGRHAYTLGEIRGVPVFYQHQAPGEAIQVDLWVEFVIDDVVARVSSVAIDFDELIRIADALIAQLQQPSPPPP
jgi:hypothetical protein